jgi:hypothetical protein
VRSAGMFTEVDISRRWQRRHYQQRDVSLDSHIFMQRRIRTSGCGRFDVPGFWSVVCVCPYVRRDLRERTMSTRC